jgi:hypothetical protein
MLQHLLVGLIVAGCATYVGWALLMPAALRRRIAGMLLRRQRWPMTVRRRLESAAGGSAGCRCDGCDGGARAGKAAVVPVVPAATAVHTVHWAPRRRR